MATENSWSGPWRSEAQVSVKRKLIDLITISDDEYEGDQNHTSSSSERPQDQISNPISATSFTTTNTPTIMTSIRKSGSTRESVIRKLIETIHISDSDDEVDSSHTVESSPGSQTPGHSSRSHQIPSSLTSRKKLKSNLDTKPVCCSGTAEKQRDQLLILKNVPHTHQTPASASAQPKKILKPKLKALLQRKINQKNISMIPGFSVLINAALNKVKLESDYIPVKSETTVNMDLPLLPVYPPPPPPLPQVGSFENVTHFGFGGRG